MSGRFVLLYGNADAGKTTLAKRLEADGAVRLYSEEWLVTLGFDIYGKDARVAVEMLTARVADDLALFDPPLK